jgi:hypothetical protein
MVQRKKTGNRWHPKREILLIYDGILWVYNFM